MLSIVLMGGQIGWVSSVFAQEARQGVLSETQMSELAKRFSTTQQSSVARADPILATRVAAVAAPQMNVKSARSKAVPVAPVPSPSLRAMVQQGALPADSELRLLMREMVGKALQHSPEARVANANEMAADYEIDEVKGRRWPQVRLGVDTALTKQNGGRDSRSGDSTGTLNITTNVWDWGRNKYDIYSAEAALDLIEQTGEVELEQVAFSTASELINLIRAQKSVVVVEDYVLQMSNRVEMLSKIVDNDTGRGSELVQARAKLLSAQASRQQIQNQQKIAQIKLKRLLGEEAPLVPGGVLANTQPMIEPAAALAALDKHPMLLRLKARAEVEEGRAQSHKAQGLPGLNLVVRKEQNQFSGSANQNRQNDWYAGLEVQWDVFNGGANKAAQQVAIARKSSAMEEYDKVDQDLRQEINRLVQSRANAAQLADEYQRLSLETDRIRKMFYEQWYNLGKRTLLDVLIAENDHFNSQLQAINNRCDSVMADLSILSGSAKLISYLAP